MVSATWQEANYLTSQTADLSRRGTGWLGLLKPSEGGRGGGGGVG